MIVNTHLITAKEFAETAPSDKRNELVKGVVVEMDPAGEEDGREGMSISWRLAQFIDQNKLGRSYMAETGFVSNARLAQGKRSHGFFEGAPDLAVGVSSPSESAEDIQQKVIEYLQAGTRMIIYLHPRTQTITVYRSLDEIRVLTLNDTFDGGDVLPGFKVGLGDIFGG